MSDSLNDIIFESFWKSEAESRMLSQRKIWTVSALQHIVQTGKATLTESFRIREMIYSSDTENLTLTEAIINQLLKTEKDEST